MAKSEASNPDKVNPSVFFHTCFYFEEKKQKGFFHYLVAVNLYSCIASAMNSCFPLLCCILAIAGSK